MGKLKTDTKIISAIIIVVMLAIGLMLIFNAGQRGAWPPLPQYAETKIKQCIYIKTDPLSDRKWRIETGVSIRNGRIWESAGRWNGYVYENEIAAEKKRQRELAEARAKEARRALLIWRDSK